MTSELIRNENIGSYIVRCFNTLGSDIAYKIMIMALNFVSLFLGFSPCTSSSSPSVSTPSISRKFFFRDDDFFHQSCFSFSALCHLQSLVTLFRFLFLSLNINFFGSDSIFTTLTSSILRHDLTRRGVGVKDMETSQMTPAHLTTRH